MKTHIYVDGYNLYYGRLKGTPFKWLDVGALARRLARAQHPESDVCCIRYFTAPALASYARRGDASAAAQTSYHRALEWVHGVPPAPADGTHTVYVPGQPPPPFLIINGRHSLQPNVPYPRFVPGQPASKDDCVAVWELIEKETDVNLAMTLYRDVVKYPVDQVVLFSNDSDARPALRALSEDFPHVVRGVVAPVLPGKVASTTLGELATWHRKSIDDQDLAACQLPQIIHRQGADGRKGRKPIHKPKHWYAGEDL